MTTRYKLALGAFILLNLALTAYVAAGRYYELKAQYERGGAAAPAGSPQERFLSSLQALDDRGQFERLHEAARLTASGKAVVALFSSVCTSCASGRLMYLLNEHAGRNQDVAYFALVPDTFTAGDISNLRTNLNVSFPVEAAGPALSREWQSLREQYGEGPVNAVVLVIGSEGIDSLAQGANEADTLLEELSR